MQFFLQNENLAPSFKVFSDAIDAKKGLRDSHDRVCNPYRLIFKEYHENKDEVSSAEFQKICASSIEKYNLNEHQQQTAYKYSINAYSEYVGYNPFVGNQFTGECNHLIIKNMQSAEARGDMKALNERMSKFITTLLIPNKEYNLYDNMMVAAFNYGLAREVIEKDIVVIPETSRFASSANERFSKEEAVNDLTVLEEWTMKTAEAAYVFAENMRIHLGINIPNKQKPNFPIQSLQG